MQDIKDQIQAMLDEISSTEGTPRFDLSEDDGCTASFGEGMMVRVQLRPRRSPALALRLRCDTPTQDAVAFLFATACALPPSAESLGAGLRLVWARRSGSVA